MMKFGLHAGSQCSPDASCALMALLSVSSGVLGYYHAQLNDMIQYPDLRTEVFQCFQEVGNGILFCLQMEQALVSPQTNPLSYS